MFKPFAHSRVVHATKRAGCWCAAAVFALGGVAPLSAQSHGSLQYVDHQNVGGDYFTVLSTNIAFSKSYFDSEGDINRFPTATLLSFYSPRTFLL